MNIDPTNCRNAETPHLWRRIQIIVPVVVLAGFLISVLFFRFSSPSLPEIDPGSPREILALASSWTQGDLTVLIRHMERCDRSAAPCIDVPDGITIRGKNRAVAVGAVFDGLGLQRADIFTSPTARTKQTAMYMFKTAVREQEWLADCKTITLDKISKYKVEGRNLILVTHSQCIEKLEKTMGFSAFKEANYGSLMFISIDKKTNKPISAELIEAEQFITAFTKPK